MRKLQFGLIIVIGILLSILLYFPGIEGKFFSDDFQFWFLPYDKPLYHTFIDKNMAEHTYRPLEKITLLLVQKHFGTKTMPLHILQLLLHIFLSVCILVWLLKKGYSPLLASLGFAYLLCTQSAVHAVASNDTISQQYATIFGCFSVVMIMRFLVCKERRSKLFTYAASLTGFLFAIAGKETALGYIGIILLLLFKSYEEDNTKKNIVNKVMLLIPYCIIIIGYLLLRNFIGLQKATFGNEDFNISLGFNIVKNFGLLVFQSLLPFSSLDIFLAVRNKEVVLLLCSIVLVAVQIIVVAIPLFNKHRRKFQAYLLLIAPCTLLPVILLNHVSELYVYPLLPVVAVLLVNGLKIISEKKPVAGKIVFGIVVICLIINCQSAHSKIKLMYSNGEKTSNLLQEIKPFISGLQPQTKLVLLVPENSVKNDYSIFKRTGFRLLEDGLIELNRLSGRNDLVSEILVCDSISSFKQNEKYLGLYNGRVKEIISNVNTSGRNYVCTDRN